MSRFLACWAVQAPVGVGGDAEDVDAAGFDLHDEEHVQAFEEHGVNVRIVA
jgi:hypothetical protein